MWGNFKSKNKLSGKKQLTIDARMQSHTGIGRVIEHLLPRVKARLQGVSVSVLNEDISIYSLQEQRKLPKLIKGANLLWSPHYNIPICTKVPYVVTIHDMAHLDLAEHKSSVFKQIYAKMLLGRVAKKAKHIVCVSEFTKLRWLHYFPDAAYKTTVIYHGAPDATKPIPKASETPYFLFIGNIKPHKNLGTLLRAFEQVKDAIPHDLYIIGQFEGLRTQDGKAWKMLESLKPRVKLLGKVGDKELKTYLAGAEALVFPSKYEGFGLPPLEAMAFDVPVIAANAASIPEVCGDAALYCDPKSETDIASKLQMFASDPVLKAEFIEKGRERVKQFSWEKAADEYAAIFKQQLEA